MIHCLLAFVLWVPSVQTKDTDDSSGYDPIAFNSSLSVITSVYGTLGVYSTSTDTRSFSAYVTLAKAWRDYYTVGFSNLWLARSDAGGKYYSQQTATARASVFVSDRISVSGHYAFLHESAITNYSVAETIHWLGAGANYWFSYFTYAGASLTFALMNGSPAASAVRVWYSFDLGLGVRSTSMVVTTNADWSPLLFAFRQVASVPVGNDSYVLVWGDFGRRGFYFDDESLVAYNQRDIQSSSYTLKAIVRLFGSVYAVPSFEIDSFDDYTVKYGSLGIRFIP